MLAATASSSSLTSASSSSSSSAVAGITASTEDDGDDEEQDGGPPVPAGDVIGISRLHLAVGQTVDELSSGPGHVFRYRWTARLRLEPTRPTSIPKRSVMIDQRVRNSEPMSMVMNSGSVVRRCRAMR